MSKPHGTKRAELAQLIAQHVADDNADKRRKPVNRSRRTNSLDQPMGVDGPLPYDVIGIEPAFGDSVSAPELTESEDEETATNGVTIDTKELAAVSRMFGRSTSYLAAELTALESALTRGKLPNLSGIARVLHADAAAALAEFRGKRGNYVTAWNYTAAASALRDMDALSTEGESPERFRLRSLVWFTGRRSEETPSYPGTVSSMREQLPSLAAIEAYILGEVKRQTKGPGRPPTKGQLSPKPEYNIQQQILVRDRRRRTAKAVVRWVLRASGFPSEMVNKLDVRERSSRSKWQDDLRKKISATLPPDDE